jgi:hypothetical protein
MVHQPSFKGIREAVLVRDKAQKAPADAHVRLGYTGCAIHKVTRFHELVPSQVKLVTGDYQERE